MRITGCHWVLLLVAGCATVGIQDHEFCADAGPNGASCFHSLSKDERRIYKEDWDRISIPPEKPTPEELEAYKVVAGRERFGQICTQPETFADIKGAVEKLCALTKKCIYQKEAKTFFDKVEATKPK